MSRLSVFIKGGNTAEPDACYSDAFSHIPVDYSIIDTDYPGKPTSGANQSVARRLPRQGLIKI
jgi:hypothetical protein